MIRSSRIPKLLDKICVDGITASLLITKDGELLGSSTTFRSKMPLGSNINNNSNSNSDDMNHNGISDEEMVAVDEELNFDLENENNNNMFMISLDPRDMGALLAEVVEDYKRLGSELALMSRPINNDDKKHDDQQQQQQQQGKEDVSNHHAAQHHHQQQTSSSSTTGQSATNDAKHASKDRIQNQQKDRKRMQCLILEMEKGYIGISSVTSNTYVIAIAESHTQHGILKDKLTVLSNLMQEHLEMVHHT